jgi:hypothetical protein
MKTRSALLVAFMILVPAAAMFSHRIPSDVRRSIREQITQWATAVMPAKVDAATETGAVVDDPSERPEPIFVAAPASGGAAGSAPLPRAAVAGSGDLRGSGSVMGSGGVTGGDDVAGGLARLGAIGFECRPVAGADGAHVASCSVPLDGSGQLLRVFHVTGVDARSASTALLEDVTAWRDRTGVRHAAAEPAVPSTRPLRF